MKYEKHERKKCFGSNELLGYEHVEFGSACRPPICNRLERQKKGKGVEKLAKEKSFLS